MPPERGANSFPKSRRLARTSEFDRVFGRRTSSADALLIVYAAPSALPYPRLGLSIGRKVGDSVTRNRVKRLVREAFRVAAVPSDPACDFVVVARKEAASASFADIQNSFRKLVTDLLRRCR